VFYDVTTFYFEVDGEDELRKKNLYDKSGHSIEQRGNSTDTDLRSQIDDYSISDLYLRIVDLRSGNLSSEIRCFSRRCPHVSFLPTEDRL
jgi:hypothetical protein